MRTQRVSVSDNKGYWDVQAASTDGLRRAAEFEQAFNLELAAQLDKYSEDVEIVRGITSNSNFNGSSEAWEVHKDIVKAEYRLLKQFASDVFKDDQGLRAVYEKALVNLADQTQVQFDSLYLLRPKKGSKIKHLTLTDNHADARLRVPCVLAAEATATLPPAGCSISSAGRWLASGTSGGTAAAFSRLSTRRRRPRTCPSTTSSGPTASGRRR